MSVLYDDVQMDQQPRIQQFGKLCNHYQDIYEWIKRSGLPFILTQRSMGRN